MASSKTAPKKTVKAKPAPKRRKMSKAEKARRAKERAKAKALQTQNELLVGAVESHLRLQAIGAHQMRASYFRIEFPPEAAAEDLLKLGLIERLFDRAARDGVAVVGGGRTYALTTEGERVAKRALKKEKGLTLTELRAQLAKDPEVVSEREAEAERQRELQRQITEEREERINARAEDAADSE